MTIEIASYRFEGPYTTTQKLEDRSGLYAILRNTSTNQYAVIDIGESHTVKSRVENHDRKMCWQRQCDNGVIYYAVYYTPGVQQIGRLSIEQIIRQKYDPPCGKQ